MAYSFNVKLQEGAWEVLVDTNACYGCYEHDEEGEGGGLWFEVMPRSKSGFEHKLELTDYDGRFQLPREVIAALRNHGFVVGPDFD